MNWSSCRSASVLLGIAAFFSVTLSGAVALGVPPTVINVEVDYMYYPDDHIHRLYPEEIAALVQMFACQGITLNIEISDSIPEIAILPRTQAGSIFENDDTESGGFLALKNQYYNHTGEPGWHYCIMAHQYMGADFQVTSSSGLAEIGGDDFIVTLGSWFAQVGYPTDRAGTFAHELGHNLGLFHTGDQSSTILQYKPNMPSVMTYRYQVWGVLSYINCYDFADDCHVVPLKHLDYSHGLLPSIDESALDERVGIGLGAIDWDCDASIDAAPVVIDLSSDWGWCGQTSNVTLLHDFDEWSNISDETFQKSAIALRHLEEVECLTYEKALELRADKSAPCVWYPAPLTVEACVQPAADDPDLDGIRDSCDNCPTTANSNQIDTDQDGIGDACEIVCACDCHGDPACDGLIADVLDVVSTINVAFRNASEIPDPNILCPHNSPDVDCSGFTDVIDVVKAVTVAFRNGNPATEYCDPCP